MSKLMNGLREIEGIKIYGDAAGKIPLASFNIEGVHHADLAMLLDKMGVAVRSGMMCCEPLMSRFGVTGMVRVSLAVYNTAEEIDVLLKSLSRAVGMLRQ
jgi:cysteine desulfurase/selenocysteine lyase